MGSESLDLHHLPRNVVISIMTKSNGPVEKEKVEDPKADPVSVLTQKADQKVKENPMKFLEMTGPMIIGVGKQMTGHPGTGLC